MVWVGRDDVVLGCLLLADLPRPEAREAVIALRELGLTRVVLLTGDRRHVAAQVAKTLDIEHVVAEVLPEQKLQAVQAEKAAGRSVMVVGDGVNDALALASGDVGVAMGAMGSDVALKSADVALMTNDLARLPLAVRLSRARERRSIRTSSLARARPCSCWPWPASALSRRSSAPFCTTPAKSTSSSIVRVCWGLHGSKPGSPLRATAQTAYLRFSLSDACFAWTPS